MFNKLAIAALCSAFAMPGYAQLVEDPHGDVEGAVVDGQIIVDGEEAVASGGYIFEGDFSDEHEGAYGTDAPGFDIGGFSTNANEALAFYVEGPLQFWDGMSWGVAQPGSEITLEGSFGNDFIINGSSTGQTGLVTVGTQGQGDENPAPGVVHSHIDFVIDEDAAPGAYLFEIALFGYGWERPEGSLFAQLTTELYDADVPVYIALDFGSSDFEAAVEAFANPVPVPAAWLFMASGLGSLLLGRRFKS